MWMAVRCALAGAVIVVTVAACGSDGDGGSDPCGGVCGCVAAEGGDASQCREECNAILANEAESDKRKACEDRLDSYGFSQCQSHCTTFPKG